jgi:hypothetical protein
MCVVRVVPCQGLRPFFFTGVKRLQIRSKRDSELADAMKLLLKQSSELQYCKPDPTSHPGIFYQPAKMIFSTRSQGLTPFPYFFLPGNTAEDSRVIGLRLGKSKGLPLKDIDFY